jgi:DNA-binding LytR/AlgR family response regulator
MGHVPVRPSRLLVRHGAGHSLIPVASISRFAARDDLVYAHASKNRYAVDYTLAELESRLAGAFVRVSRTDLISIAHISGIRSNGDGSATLSLESGDTVRASRRRTSAVRQLLKR